jgi:circadian clock protein KaiB
MDSCDLILYVGQPQDFPQSLRERVLASLEMSEMEVTLEVVNALAEPQRASDDGVIATPLLIRTLPPPRVKAIGDVIKAIEYATGIDVMPEDDPRLADR